MLHSQLATIAAAFACRRYDVTAPFLPVGTINSMKKDQIKAQLKSRGMNVIGTARKLRAELRKRVFMEKHGKAERPTVNAFTWKCDEIRYFLKEANRTNFSHLRKEGMLELLILTVEDAKLARRLQEEAALNEKMALQQLETELDIKPSNGKREWHNIAKEEEEAEAERPAKRARKVTGVVMQQEAELNNKPRRNKRQRYDDTKEEEAAERPAKRACKPCSAVKVASFVAKPVIFTAKAMHFSGKTMTTLAKKSTRYAKDSIRGYQAYRNSGGRQGYKVRVDTKAKQIQRVHRNYGNKTFLGFRSFCGISFGPKGVSKAKATRMAREFENARLRRSPTDPIIKGYFGSLDDVERRIKEAEFNAHNVNNKKTRPIVNPYAPRKFARSRVQVKFNLA